LQAGYWQVYARRRWLDTLHAHSVWFCCDGWRHTDYQIPWPLGRHRK